MSGLERAAARLGVVQHAVRVRERLGAVAVGARRPARFSSRVLRRARHALASHGTCAHLVYRVLLGLHDFLLLQ